MVHLIVSVDDDKLDNVYNEIEYLKGINCITNKLTYISCIVVEVNDDKSVELQKSIALIPGVLHVSVSGPLHCAPLI